MGRIQGASPWTRGAIRRLGVDHPDTLAQLEAAIPDGARVVLTAGRSPRVWGAVLLTDAEIARVDAEYRTVTSAVGALLWKAGQA